MTALEDLIVLAQEIVDHTGKEDEALTHDVTHYTQKFSDWQAAWTKPSNETEVRNLKKLAALHTQVLKRAQKMVSVAGAELRRLRVKKKGILAYIGTPPRRVSSIQTRKG